MMSPAFLNQEAATKETVLVIEDDGNLLRALQYSLEREGYSVRTAIEGESGLEAARESRPSLVILDVMLPRLDGFEVCRILRRDNDVPVLMLTARGEEIDRVLGLELGADDYVVKPFSMRELLARVKAMLRRSRMEPDGLARTEGRQVFTSSDLEVDVDSHTATLGGKALSLKPRVFELLALLMARKGRILSRNQILDHIWGHNYVGDSRTVDVHIRWLREKIEENPGEPRRVITVRRVGYRFEG